MIDVEEIKRRFAAHTVEAGAAQSMKEVRDAAGALADTIVMEAPPCRETSLAITHLEEAVFWANAAIARPAAKR